MSERSLVLGATGSFGGAVALELLARGRPVRVLARTPARAEAALAKAGAALSSAEIIAGDVQDGAALREAAADCALVVHGVNYPYDLWLPHMETATANVIAAAKAAGATILFPGNVYGLGAQDAGPLSEDAANRPCSKKGALRVRLEEELRRAAADGVQVVVLRAGDYFGPTVRNGLVDPLFRAALAGRTMWALGDLSIPHQWAYVPDLARAAVELLDRRAELEPFAVVNFAGTVADPGRAFLEAIAREAGHPEPRILRLPWLVIRAAGLFDGVLRELVEMRYLFERSIVLDGGRLARLLPDYRDTPLAAAIAATLDSYRAESAAKS